MPDLTVREFAAEVRLSEWNIWNKCKQGKLPGAYQTNGDTGRWRIPEESLEQFRRKPVKTKTRKRKRVTDFRT